MRNETDREWLIRVVIGGGYGEQHWVSVVPPASTGVAVEWIGEMDRSIELLDGDCNVVGLFRTSDGTSYSVEGIDGLEGTIAPWGTNIGDQSGRSMAYTGKCGGTTLM